MYICNMLTDPQENVESKNRKSWKELRTMGTKV